MKKQDIIFIAGILLIGMILLAAYRIWYHTLGGTVEVSIDGKVYQTMSLSKDTTITLPAENGYNILTIRNGCADITDANCPDKLCVKQKKIRHAGETLVCLPHKLVVKVTDSAEKIENGPDAISQ